MSDFDLNRLKIPANFDVLYGGVPELRTPTSSENIYVHPDWKLRAAVVKVGSKCYVVASELFTTLRGRMFEATLVPFVSDEHGINVWPLKESGKGSKSAHEAAEAAKEGWSTVKWEGGEYTVTDAETDLDDPEWVFSSAKELFQATIQGIVLTDPECDNVKKLLEKS